MKFSNTFIASILVLGLTGCSDDKKPGKPTPDGKVRIAEDIGLKVVSETGEAIAGAQIAIGATVVTTDETGSVAVPATWTEKASVSISAKNFVQQTLLDQAPGAMTYSLKAKIGVPKFQLSGVTKGHNIVNGDGLIDFGLVMETIQKKDLASFQIEKAVSPLEDHFTVMGRDAAVPSNITMPKQTESYIFNITLEKPQYRFYFPQSGGHQMVALQGRFPFKTIVDGIRSGKKVFQMVNEFNLLSGAIRSVTLRGSQSVMDLDTTDFSFSAKKKISSPTFAQDEVYMAIAATKNRDRLIPNDLKLFETPGQIGMNFKPNEAPFVLGVLKKREAFMDKKDPNNLLSLTILPASEKTPMLLPLSAVPTYSANSGIKVAVPNSRGLNKLGMSAILSEVVEYSIGNEKALASLPVLEVYAAGWSSTMKVPEVPREFKGKNLRWMVTFYANQSEASSALGSLMENSTHITQSSVDFN